MIMAYIILVQPYMTYDCAHEHARLYVQYLRFLLINNCLHEGHA